MALRPDALYPGQIDLTDAPNFPYGKAKNDQVEGDVNGTPFEAALVNEGFGFQQALLVQSGIVPTGVPEGAAASQYVDAVRLIGGSVPATHRALQQWEYEQLPFLVGGRDCFFEFLLGVAVPGQKQRMVVALGRDTNDSDRYVYSRSFGGGFADDLTSEGSGSFQGPRAAAAGIDGEWLAGNGTTLIVRSNLGAVDVQDSYTPGVVHYAPGATGHPYIYFRAASGTIRRSDISSFGGFTTSTPPAGLTAFAIPSLGQPSGEVADDGGLNIVYAGSCTVSGSTRFRLLTSNDGGDTWFARSTKAASSLSLGVTWSNTRGLFVAVGESAAGDLTVETSPDGVTWTTTSTALFPTTSLSTRHNTVAEVGGVIVKALRIPFYGGTSYGAGVAYSTDLGVTWRICAFGRLLTSAEDILAIRTINGRVYATNGTAVYRSGIVEPVGPDL